MRIPVACLKEFVDISLPMEDLANSLTMAGLEVGGVITIGGWQNCLIGLVDNVDQHPNADRLSVCVINIGETNCNVVCGAPNVKKGQKVALATPGFRMPDSGDSNDIILKSTSIRGVLSEGMICSERDLGISDRHEGILVLSDEAPVGIPLNEYLSDQVLDLVVTPNRPDCLSVLGVAYEVAAVSGSRVHLPQISYPEDGERIEDLTEVEVIDPDLCSRYTVGLIKDVSVGPSPGWLQDRLLKAGMRPINNIVDVTNYVMLEYGQPLHAFDFDSLSGGRIFVRKARGGEIIETLDGIRRELDSSMLVIADDSEPVGLAGVIGGKNSEISDKTTTVLLESASFHPVNNRRTAQSLGLRTDATIRFEKGLRTGLPEVALRRAIQLIHYVAGGTISRGIFDVNNVRDTNHTLILTHSRIKMILGVEYPRSRVSDVLSSLGFVCNDEGSQDLSVIIPYWRSDITIEDDLVEEIARVIGYDSIPTQTLSTAIPSYQPNPLRIFREDVRDLLVGLGLQEVISYPLTSIDYLEKVNSAIDDKVLLKLTNPLTIEHEYLRPTLRTSLLKILSSNQSEQKGPVNIFEIGRVYLYQSGGLPDERETVAGVLFGPHVREGWLGSDSRHDFYDAKGLVEEIMNQLHISANYSVINDPFLHPGRSASVFANGNDVGVIGEIHPDVQDSFDIDGGAIAFFEFDLEKLAHSINSNQKQFKQLIRFPLAIRDISILVDCDVPAIKIRELIEDCPLVEEATLFDVYVGDKMPDGKNSLSYRIYFRSSEKTLNTNELEQALQQIVTVLNNTVDAELRDG